MNRRSFFKGLAAIGAGITLFPAIKTSKRFLPGWQYTERRGLYVAEYAYTIKPNPEWVRCNFEVRYFDQAALIDEAILRPEIPEIIALEYSKEANGYLRTRKIDAFPVRVDEQGRLVSPFIMERV